jgi:iron(III) transport system substrate-binding protein
MFRSVRLVAAASVLLVAAPIASANGEVNLYSYRQSFLIQPMLDAFTAQSGIKVNVVFADKGMVQKIKAAGSANRADAVLTVDIGRLDALREADLLEPIKSDVLEKNIPANLRHPDGLWFGLTTRARVVLASRDRVAEGEVKSLQDLADPRFKGKICTRSGKHVYNVGLIASVIAHQGSQAAEQWLRGVKANLARKPQGNDRAQAKGIYEGVCDLAISNHYYMGKMATNKKKPEQMKWAAAVRVVFLDQNAQGNHVNISGVGVIKTGKNKDNAQALIEFLVSPEAQRMYAQDNFEYPVRVGVELHPMLASWGEMKADPLSLQKIAENRTQASKLVDIVDFNAGL